jgi:hypothetical protein
MVLQNLDFKQTDKIQITLFCLKDGSRLIRFSEPETGLALERALNPNRPLLRDKKMPATEWLASFIFLLP